MRSDPLTTEPNPNPPLAITPPWEGWTRLQGVAGIRHKWVSPDRQWICKVTGDRDLTEAEIWASVQGTWLETVLVPTPCTWRTEDQTFTVQPYYDGCVPLPDYKYDNPDCRRSKWWDLNDRVHETFRHLGYKVDDLAPRQFLQLPNGDVKLADYEFMT